MVRRFQEAAFPSSEGTVPGSAAFHELMLHRPDLAGPWWAYYRSHPRIFWLHCVTIKDKAFNEIPFDIDHRDYAKCQNVLYAALLAQWQQDQRIRVTELKCRQLGSTAFWLYVALWLAVVCVPNSQGIISADTTKKAQDILQRLRDAIEAMPTWVRPEFDRDAIGRISFDGWAAPEAVPGRPRASSFLICETAGSDAGGRSYMWNIVLFSEAGYYGAECKNYLAGIRNSVSEKAPGMVALESTAYGWGGEFHEECRRSAAKKNGYKFIFIPWFAVGEYRMDPHGGDAQRMKRADFDPVAWCTAIAAGDTSGLDEEELELVRRNRLEGPQLLWRRWALSAKCADDLDTFHRDFPATPNEAFISTGRPVFHLAALAEIHRKHVRLPLLVGECVLGEDGRPRFVRSERGRVKLWQEPQPKRLYLAGCDPAAGAENWNSPEERPGDNATIQILLRGTREQVAEVAGPYPPDEAGEIMLALCLWYNGAIAVIENNSGYGTPIINRFKKYGYPAIYSREVWDTRTNQQLWQLGWNTNPATRPMMFTTARGIVRTQKVIIHSDACIKEMVEMEYKALPSGGVKPVAKMGKKDDRVTNLAMLLQVDADLGAPGPEEVGDPNLIKYDAADPRAFMWGYVNAQVGRPKTSHLE